MVCCGQLYTATFPIGASADTKASMIQDIIKQCANRQAYCNDLPPGTPPTDPNNTPPTPIQLYYNRTKACRYLCPDGSGFVFTVPAGTFADTSQDNADSEAQNYACQMAKLRRICLTSNLPKEACANSSFNYTITASGSTVESVGNIWHVVSGSLPNGLSLSGSGPTINVTGTPTTGGTFSFTVEISTFTGDTQSKSFIICIVDISPASSVLTTGTVGTAYTNTFTATSCATAPLSWQVSSGTLPTGLTLNETTGVLSGTPTVAGTYNFTIKLQDSAT